MDIFGKIFAIILVVIMVFLNPIQYVMEVDHSTCSSFVESRCNQFVNDTLSSGVIKKDDYESLQMDLLKTGKLYDIKMEHVQSVDGIEFASDKAVGEYKEEFVKLRSASHEHSEACYTGHIHEGSPKFTYYHRHSGCWVRPLVRYVRFYCPTCEENKQYAFWSLSSGYYEGYDYAMNPDRPGYQCTCICGTKVSTFEQAISWGYDCGFDKDLDGDGLYDRDVTGYLEYPNYSSYPQNPNSKIHTENNGCYQYHDSQNIQSRYRYDTEDRKERPFANDTETYDYSLVQLGRIFDYFPEQLKTDLCYVPRYYDFEVSCGSRAATVTYELIIPEDESEPYFKYVESLVPHNSTENPSRYYYSWRNLQKETIANFKLYTTSAHTEYLEYKFKETISLEDIGSYIHNYNFQWLINNTCSFHKEDGTIEYPSLFVNSGNGVYPYLELYTSGIIELCGRYGDDGWKCICGQPEERKLVCNEIITSLKPVNEVQTIKEGESIDTSLEVTYLDGTKATVNGTCDFDTSVIGDNQATTIKYYGRCSSTQYNTYSCPLIVNVKPKKVLDSITVDLSSTIVEKYSELPIKDIVLNYDDGSSEIVYEGWEESGYQNTQAGIYTVTFSYTKEGITKETSVVVTVTNLTTICPNCEQSYYMNDDDIDEGCPYCREEIDHIDTESDFFEFPKGTPLNILVFATYQDGHREVVTGWTSNYDKDTVGSQEITIEYKSYEKKITVNVKDSHTCPYCNRTFDVGPEGFLSCPYCSTELVSLLASPSMQKVQFGEQLTLTVMGTYKDGHSEEIKDYTTNYKNNITGVQIVEVRSENVSTTIQVEVLPILETCEICGREYDPMQYPMGCPYCADEIERIEAYLVNDSTQVQLGSDLSLRIVVIYRNANRVLRFTGYTYENYNKNQLGDQTVTVYYKGYSCYMKIEVVNMRQTISCPNGHVYYLLEDGTDPGCPYCSESNHQLAKTYTKVVFNEEILERLYTDGYYQIPKGDCFSLTVVPKTKNLELVRFMPNSQIVLAEKKYSYGGEVR